MCDESDNCQWHSCSWSAKLRTCSRFVCCSLVELFCTSKTLLQAFSGTQNVSSQQKDEAWRVNVRIQGCDLDHGYLCGTMEALNVPMADTPVIENFCLCDLPMPFSLFLSCTCSVVLQYERDSQLLNTY